MKTTLWLPLLALAVAGCTLGHSAGPAAAPPRTVDVPLLLQ